MCSAPSAWQQDLCQRLSQLKILKSNNGLSTCCNYSRWFAITLIRHLLPLGILKPNVLAHKRNYDTWSIDIIIYFPARDAIYFSLVYTVFCVGEWYHRLWVKIMPTLKCACNVSLNAPRCNKLKHIFHSAKWHHRLSRDNAPSLSVCAMSP